MRREARRITTLSLALSTSFLLGGCARNTPSPEAGPSSPEVTASAPPLYEATRSPRDQEIDAERIDRALASELARRARGPSGADRAATRPDGVRFEESVAAVPGRPASRDEPPLPVVSERPPLAAVASLEPTPVEHPGNGRTPSDPIPTDRFRAIPLERPVQPEPAAVRPTERFREVRLWVAAGTTLEVELDRDLSSQSSQVGEPFGARVVAPVSVDGYFAIPVGAEVVGQVEEVQRARRLGGRARLALVFDRLLLPTGEVSLNASLFDETDGEAKRDAAAIGGATLAGAILGRAIGDENRTRGGALGALIGAAIGTGIASAKEGVAIELPAGSRLHLGLEEAIEVAVRIRVLEVP